MRARLLALAPADCPVRALADRRLLAWAAAWAVVSGVAFGLVSAIIPNPVFGRSVPPTDAGIAIWLVSSPLMGLLIATYTAPPVAAVPTPLVMLSPGPPADERRGSLLASVGSFGAFLAIGCPVCNKVALVLLGTSGALSLWAPIQPLVGVASLVLLAGTLAWRLRIRARGGACAA
jgi:hypothetical protein